MKRVKPVLLCLMLAVAYHLAADTASASSIRVVGQNDVAVDRQAIQDAIDSAPEGQVVIQLQGTFQLDGTSIFIERSNLALQGVDGGATLLGVVDPGTGLPAGGGPFNRGIQIAGEELIENVVIKNLTLTGHFRAISMGDILPATGGNPCGEIVVTPGVKDIVVKNTRMENNFRSLQVTGAAENIEIKNNEILGSIEAGIFLLGGRVFCPGPPGFQEIGVLSGVVVKNNSSSTADVPGGFPLPLFVDGANRDVLVTKNAFKGGLTAILVGGDVTDVVLTSNTILEGGTQGIPVLRAGGISVGNPQLPFFPGSGFVIRKNTYAGNLANVAPGDPTLEPRDVWLQSDSADNLVEEKAGTVVLDEGVGNTVLLE